MKIARLFLTLASAAALASVPAFAQSDSHNSNNTPAPGTSSPDAKAVPGSDTSKPAAKPHTKDVKSTGHSKTGEGNNNGSATPDTTSGK
jgi:hypothetical protein